MRNEHDVTIGVEFGAKFIKIKDSSVKLQLWDTVRGICDGILFFNFILNTKII